MVQEAGKKLIVIAGPTAVGKSGTALRLAQEIGGEIISADSMQIYRGMDIGTAKVTKEEMQGIPHYLIDLKDPEEDFSAAEFKSLAGEACERIRAAGHIPILCGGTGFYIQALLYDVDFSAEDGRDGAYRAELAAMAEAEGRDAVFRLLEEADPQTAAVIDRHNLKRVIRALDYYRLHGRSISLHNEEEAGKRGSSPYDYLYFVLTGEREALYRRIDARVLRMMEEGLLQEARALYQLGLSPDATAAQAIGYKEFFPYFEGKCSLAEAVAKVQQNSRRYAKRQLTWFRREPKAIWINTDKGDPLDEIREYIQKLWN